MTMAVRRLVATAVDYACAAAWAGLVLSISVLLDAPRRLGELDPVRAQILSLATLTLPVTIALAWLEAHGGTPGKRMLGLLVVDKHGRPSSLRNSAIRTTGKVAVAWELAHAGIWRVAGGGWVPASLIAVAYIVVGVSAWAVLTGRRTWYERLADTHLRVRK